MTDGRAGFSPDGRWWWDGAQWLPALSADGRWSWDGHAWVARQRSSVPLAVLLAGLFALLLEVPYALLTFIAVAGDPAGDLETSSDMAAFVRSRERWADAYGIVAPTLFVLGLALIATGSFLLYRGRRRA